MILSSCVFFFFNDTATTEIYTLSLHDALPISLASDGANDLPTNKVIARALEIAARRLGGFYNFEGLRRFKSKFVPTDRKSTRLNSSHLVISYAGFCLIKNTT